MESREGIFHHFSRGFRTQKVKRSKSLTDFKSQPRRNFNWQAGLQWHRAPGPSWLLRLEACRQLEWRPGLTNGYDCLCFWYSLFLGMIMDILWVMTYICWMGTDFLHPRDGDLCSGPTGYVLPSDPLSRSIATLLTSWQQVQRGRNEMWRLRVCDLWFAVRWWKLETWNLQYKSIQINTNQYKSIQISTKQYKAVQSSTNLYKLDGLRVILQSDGWKVMTGASFPKSEDFMPWPPANRPNFRGWTPCGLTGR